MIKQLSLVFLLSVAAWPSVAADMLPLKPGIYVDATKPCEGAPNAAITSYWGGDNGINASQVSCKIEKLDRSGDVFTLRRSCKATAGGNAFRDDRTVKIKKRSSFQISEDANSSPSGPVYRYCGQKVVF